MNKQHRINRYLLFLVLGGLLFAGGVSAQPPRGGNQPPALPDSAGIAELMDEMATALSLTVEQKAAVSELHFEQFAEASALMDKNQGDRDGHRRAMDSLRADLDKQVKALLSDEQKTKYDAFVRSHAPGHGQQPRGRH